MTRRLIASSGGDLCPSGSLNKTGRFFEQQCDLTEDQCGLYTAAEDCPTP